MLRTIVCSLLVVACQGGEARFPTLSGEEGLPVALSGSDWRGYIGPYTAWIGQCGLPADDPGTRWLAEMLARWSRPEKIKLDDPATGQPQLRTKYAKTFVDAAIVYASARSLVLARVADAGYRTALLEDLAWRCLGNRQDVDPAVEQARIAALPAGTAATIIDQASLDAALTAALPVWKTAAPAERLRWLTALAGINPALRPAGWQRLAAGSAVGETWPHAAVPLADGRIHVERWEVRYGGGIVIPPPAWFQAAPAVQPETVIDEPAPTTHRLTLTDGLGDGIPLALQVSVSADGGWNAVLSAPTMGNRTCRLMPADPAFAPSSKDRRNPVPVIGPDTDTMTVADGHLRGAAFVSLPETTRPAPSGMLLLTCDIDLAAGTGTWSLRGKGGRSGSVARAAPAPTQTFAAGAAWTSWLGSPTDLTGTCGAALPGAAPLVADLDDARLAWTCDQALPNGRAKDTRGKPVALAPGEALSGSYATPVVAQGRVVFASYEPSGHAMAYGAEDDAAHRLCRIAADEVVTCFDAATGATRWRRRLPDAGLNFAGFNKGGPKLSAVIAGDRVVVAGTMGLVWCFDLRDGAPLWRSDIGPRAEIMRMSKRQALAERSLLSTRNDLITDPMVVGDAVLISDVRHTKVGYRYEVASGTIALDLATGKRRWHLAEVGSDSRFYAGAFVWRSAGKEWAILPTAGGIALVDPADGAIRWTCAEVVMPSQGVGIHQDILVAERADGSGLAGVRLAPERATPLWTVPGLTGVEGNIAAADGRFFVAAKRPQTQISIIEAATGKILAATPAPFAGGEHCPFIVHADGRLILPTDRTDAYLIADADPARLAGSVRAWNADLATGYCGSILPAVVDGRLIVRHVDRLVCYDLRAGQQPLPHADLLKRTALPADKPADKPAAGKPASKPTENEP